MPNKLNKNRLKAYLSQNGRCVYCEAPIWIDSHPAFAAQHNISLGQAKLLQCTAEHLVARQQGGEDVAENIAAACLFCNRLRHARRKPLEPHQYKLYVRRRIAKKKWLLALIPQLHLPADV